MKRISNIETRKGENISFTSEKFILENELVARVDEGVFLIELLTSLINLEIIQAEVSIIVSKSKCLFFICKLNKCIVEVAIPIK